MSKLIKDSISKSLIVFKVFLEKILEFFLRYQIFGFKATFLLMLLLYYCFPKKKNKKKDLIWPISLSGFKIVFTLWAKIKTI